MVSAKTIIALIAIGAFFFLGGGKFIKPALSASKQIVTDIKEIAPTLKSKAELRADELKEEFE